jgi:hypothetical protein
MTTGNRWLAPCLALLAAGVLGGCATVRNYNEDGFRLPAEEFSVIVLPPDVHLGELSLAGRRESREDWTQLARENLIAALRDRTLESRGRVTVAATPAEAEADPQLLERLDLLHEVVGRSIQRHKFGYQERLPTKELVFDWTLGDLAVEFGRQSGHDYAMFLYAEDYFSSAGRMALQGAAMIGCTFGVCLLPPGGMQHAFASLVDLETGAVVWSHVLYAEYGDLRSPKGAETLVERMFEGIPGANPVAANTRR